MQLRHRSRSKSLDEAIEELYSHLASVMPDSDEYDYIASQLVKLESIRTNRGMRWPQPDVWVPAVTNIVGILMILHHEQLQVISSKAFSLVMRVR
jgi:hypothetical protein